MTKTTNWILALSMVASLSSCGPQGTVVRADDYDAETIVDLMNEEEPVVSGNVAKPHKPSSHQTHKPMDARHSPISGEWSIVEVAGHVINRDYDEPYVIFTNADGRFYASNGCNILNGSFTYDQDNTLTFSNVISSIRECPDVEYQDDISRVFRDGVTVNTRLDQKNRETYLYLFLTPNETLLKLRCHNLEVINGKWDVVRIGDRAIDDDGINLFFDVPERSVHGNTGCNYFNGAITIDPHVDSSISFSQMGVTMRMCPNAEIEQRLLVGLEETETYTLDGNTLYLNDRGGEHLITLRRAD